MNDNIGENNARAIVTSKDVTKLRKLFATTKLMPSECLSKLNLSIKKAQISSILRGNTWQYQDSALIDKCLARLNAPEFQSTKSGKITAEDVIKLRKYRAKTGSSLEACIEKLELPITAGNAHAIIIGRSWKSAGGPIEIPGAYGGKQRVGNANANRR